MAMKLAMKEAGVEPEEVDYINAHGTSTHHNDLFETRAICYALGDAAENVVVNSTKIYDRSSSWSGRSSRNLLSA